ncbi:MAG: CHAT domain-containing protein [Anaerolineales bacterium]|nr:CHAT domain-containing protein [Anaerolineales bacterium]
MKRLFQILITTFLVLGALGSLPGPSQAKSARQFDPGLQCSMGAFYFLNGQIATAWPMLESSLAELQTETGTPPIMVGMCGLYTGMMRQTGNDWTGAIGAYQIALTAFRQINDQQLEWATLYAIGSVYMAQGRFPEARTYFEEALPLSREPGNWSPASIQALAQASTLNNLGVVTVGQAQLGAIQAGMRIDEETSTQEADTLLQSSANSNQAYDQARAYFQEALTLLPHSCSLIESTPVAATDEVPPATPGTQPDSTEAEAMQQLEQLLKGLSDATQPEQDQPDLADLLKNLAELGAQTQPEGGAPEAAPDMSQLIALLTGLTQTNSPTQSENDMIQMLLQQGGGAGNSQAGGLGGPGTTSMASLDEMVGGTSRAIAGIVLHNLGETYRLQERYDEAMPYFDQALCLAQNNQQQNGPIGPTAQLIGLTNEAMTRNSLALIAYAKNELDSALSQFNQTLEIAQKLHHRAYMALAFSNIGFVEQQLGRPAEALSHFEAAIELFETIRVVADSGVANIVTGGGVGGGNNTYALSGALVQFADVYEMVASLYHQQGRDEEAFYTSERGRARLFLDLQLTSQLALTDPEAAALLARERMAYAVRQGAEDALFRAKVPDSLEASLIPQLESQLQDAQAAYDQALAEIKAKDSKLAALVAGQSAVLNLPDIQSQLDEQTTLVSYYFLGSEQTLAFIINRDSFATVELPQARLSAVQDTLESLYQWSNIDGTEPPAELSELYGQIIAPLRDKLRTRQVGLIPHKALHYVPFAALNKDKQYFGAEHLLFTLPSVSTLPFIRANRPATPASNQTALVFGNPATSASLQTLSSAAAEAQQVADLLGASVYTAADASENRFWAEANQAKVIHLAAHGAYNPTAPLESALYLAPEGQNDGLLQVRELYNLRLQANELVTLSACETNVGELSTGDEIVGLTRPFFFAGSPTVISSLWTVDDVATAEFMAVFYRRWQEGASKAEALQAAQEAMRKKHGPYYWAAFVLNGDPG